MITGACNHEAAYQEIYQLRKEVWNTVKELKDLIYKHDISEEYHLQNRTLNSILAKHATCTDRNALFKMHLDAQALRFLYLKHLNIIPEKKLLRRRRRRQQDKPAKIKVI